MLPTEIFLYPGCVIARFNNMRIEKKDQKTISQFSQSLITFHLGPSSFVNLGPCSFCHFARLSTKLCGARGNCSRRFPSIRATFPLISSDPIISFVTFAPHRGNQLMKLPVSVHRGNEWRRLAEYAQLKVNRAIRVAGFWNFYIGQSGT